MVLWRLALAQAGAIGSLEKSLVVTGTLGSTQPFDRSVFPQVWGSAPPAPPALCARKPQKQQGRNGGGSAVEVCPDRSVLRMCSVSSQA